MNESCKTESARTESARTEKKSGAGRTLLAFVVGAAGGAVAALLSAPASGVKSRARIAALGKQAQATAQRIPQAMRDATAAGSQAFVLALQPPRAEHPRPHAHRED